MEVILSTAFGMHAGSIYQRGKSQALPRRKSKLRNLSLIEKWREQ